MFESAYFTENASHVIKNSSSTGLMPKLRDEITKKVPYENPFSNFNPHGIKFKRKVVSKSVLTSPKNALTEISKQKKIINIEANKRARLVEKIKTNELLAEGENTAR